jgi:uncharacterized protein (DUF2147 family)
MPPRGAAGETTEIHHYSPFFALWALRSAGQTLHCGVPHRGEFSAKSPQSGAMHGSEKVRPGSGSGVQERTQAQTITGVGMKLLFQKLILLGAVLVVAAGSPVRAAEPTAVGLWEHTDENTGKPGSWFKIVEKNGIYEGTFAKIFHKPGEDPNWICSKCEGAEKNAPVLGLALIKGMKRNGLAYENGTIMDPRDGTVYRALMNLSPDGQKLEVRGFLGISLFGKSQVWTRLPNNALGPQPAAARAKGVAQEKKQ